MTPINSNPIIIKIIIANYDVHSPNEWTQLYELVHMHTWANTSHIWASINHDKERGLGMLKTTCRLLVNIKAKRKNSPSDWKIVKCHESMTTVAHSKSLHHVFHSLSR